MSKRYASTTSVPVNASKIEIERVLARYGATAFGYAVEDTRALVQFKANGRFVRFILPLPSKNERRFTYSAATLKPRAEEAATNAWEQACRQAWRAFAS